MESQAGPGPGEAWPRFCLVTAGGPGQGTTLSEPHRCGGWTLTHGGPLVWVHALWTGHRGKGLRLCQLWGLGHRGRPLSSTAPQKASCTPRSRPWAASAPGRSSRPLPSPRGLLLLWGFPFLHHTRAERPGHLQSHSTSLCLVSHASSRKSSWCPHPRPPPLPPERCCRRCRRRKRQHLAAWEGRGRVPSVRSVPRQARPASCPDRPDLPPSRRRPLLQDGKTPRPCPVCPGQSLLLIGAPATLAAWRGLFPPSLSGWLNDRPLRGLLRPARPALPTVDQETGLWAPLSTRLQHKAGTLAAEPPHPSYPPDAVLSRAPPPARSLHTAGPGLQGTPDPSQTCPRYPRVQGGYPETCAEAFPSFQGGPGGRGVLETPAVSGWVGVGVQRRVCPGPPQRHGPGLGSPPPVQEILPCQWVTGLGLVMPPAGQAGWSG